jgi:hypothetical protein
MGAGAGRTTMLTDPDNQALDPPAAPPAPPTTQSIAEARDLVSFARQFLEGLAHAGGRLEAEASANEDLKGERAWLASAAMRIEARITTVQATLAEAAPLPEFESDRQAKADAQFVAWVESAEAVLVGISSYASPNHPLVEVLFPHQKFDKIRRGGTNARAYMEEVVKRRHKSYVLRLAASPEYAFLAPLLDRFDQAKAELEQREHPEPLAEEELLRLRHAVYFAADALRGTLQQARLLAEAALTQYPGWLTELGLDAKPRRRTTRSAAPSGPSVLEPAEPA